MRLFSLKKRQPLIGIDISSTALKMVEVVKQRSGYQLKSYAIVNLPQGVIVDDILVDSDAITHAAAILTKALSVRSKKAVIAVPAAMVTTKLIDMPAHFTELEREAHIYVNAEQYLPYPLAEAYLDFEVKGRSATDPTVAQVLLVASQAKLIDQRVNALALADIETKIVETVPIAIERSFEYVYDKLPAQPDVVVLVDIGDEQTHLYATRAGAVVHRREQRFGGGQLTEAIQHKYAVNRADALDIKHTACEQQQQHSQSQPGYDEQDYIQHVLTPFIDNLIQQLSRFIQLYLSSSHSGQVDHIVLCGGTALLKNLAATVQSRLNIPTTRANPFQNMSVDSRIDVAQLTQDAPRLMTACGLALRSQYS